MLVSFVLIFTFVLVIFFVNTKFVTVIFVFPISKLIFSGPLLFSDFTRSFFVILAFISLAIVIVIFIFLSIFIVFFVITVFFVILAFIFIVVFLIIRVFFIFLFISIFLSIFIFTPHFSNSLLVEWLALSFISAHLAFFVFVLLKFSRLATWLS